jgi:hypothetical protein
LSNKWCYSTFTASYPPNIQPSIQDTTTITVIADTFIVNGNRYYTLSQNDIAGEKYVRVDSTAIRYWSPSWGMEFPVFDIKGSIDDTIKIAHGLTHLIRIDTLNIFGNSSIVRTYEIYEGLNFVGQVRYSDIYGPLTQWYYGGDPPGPWPSYTMELIGCIVESVTHGTVVSVKDFIYTPFRYTLYQNYPNPFNPTTTIYYQLSSTSILSLKVYDVLGREVATLQDGMKVAGYYTNTFDASKLTSGFYFARLTAQPLSGRPFMQVMKMTLIK